MSLIKPIDMRGKGLREVAASLISGNIGDRIGWSEELNLKIKRETGKTVVTITSGKAEVLLRGLPDPDFITAELFADHAIISLSITNVRVNY